jgi:hypothetical protein
LVSVSRGFAICALKEAEMKQRIAKLAAVVLLVGGAALAPSAFARDSFAVSIGVPGFGFGYSNRGYGYAYVAPPAVYPAPAPYYGPTYYPAPAYYAPPVVYSYGSYYRPWYRHRYYRHW